MLAISKIRTAGYAIGKRLQGYRLLKNPVGTSPTEVNMLKESLNGYSIKGERFHILKKITRFIDNDNKVSKIKKILMTTRIFDKNTKEISKDKNITYIKEQRDKVAIEERTAFDEDKLASLPDIDLNDSGILNSIIANEKSDKTKKPSFFQVLWHNLNNQ